MGKRAWERLRLCRTLHHRLIPVSFFGAKLYLTVVPPDGWVALTRAARSGLILALTSSELSELLQFMFWVDNGQANVYPKRQVQKAATWQPLRPPLAARVLNNGS
jgi:hypothetical protein